MAGIKALTNISEGAAQVFDTTEMIASQKEQKAKDEEKIIASMLDYDPNDIWQRDINKVSTDINKYESWVMENYDRLNSGGKERIAAWTEKKNLENGIRNTIAYSKKAGADVQKLSTLIQNDPDYDTQANRDLVFDFMKPPKDEDYASREAFNTIGIQDQFSRQVQIPLDKIVEHVGNSFFTNKEVRATGNEALSDKRTLNDEAGLDAYIDDIWENGDNLGGKTSAEKIQGKFKTKEALKSTIMNLVPKNVDISYYNPKTGTTSGKNNKSSLYVKNMSADVKAGSFTTATTSSYVRPVKKYWIGSATKEIPVDESKIQTEIIDGVSKQYIVDDKGVKQPVSTREEESTEVQTSFDLDFADGYQIDPLAFNVPGNVGGYDVISAGYNENLFEASSTMQISAIGRANYALKPMYAEFQGRDAKGNIIKSRKKLNAQDIIPAGAKLFADSNYKTEISGGDNGEFSKQNYVQNDLFAIVQSSDIAVKEGSGDNEYKTSLSENKGATAKSKGIVKFSSIQNMIGNSFAKYPGLAENIAKLKSNSGKDADMEEVMRNLK